MKVRGINPYNALIWFLLFYMTSNMTTSLLPQEFSMNRVVGVGIVTIAFYILIKNINKIVFSLLIVCTIICLNSIVASTNISLNIEHVVYFLTTSSLFCLLISDRTREKLLQALKRNISIVKKALYFNLFLITVGFVLPQCYSYGYVGFAQGAHQFLSCLMFVYVLTVYVLKDTPLGTKDVLMILPILIAVSMGAARTYLIPTLIISLMYYKLKLKTLKVKYFIILLIAVFGVLYLPNSFIIQRFSMATSQGLYSGQSAATAMSSGRFEIWAIDLNAFMEGNIWTQLFGKGFDYLYKYNEINYGASIWAHNDFIHILVSGGILGLLYYIYLLKMIITRPAKKNTIKKIWLSAFVIPVAIFNGMYTYQQYVFSIIFFVLLIVETENIGIEVL